MIVLPRAPSARIRSTMSIRATGSTPVSGSSSSKRSGSWAIAVASLVRCRIPFEKPRTRRCIASVMPTCAIAASAACRAAARGTPASRAITVTSSSAVSSSHVFSCSGA